jgi:hypothetical protein
LFFGEFRMNRIIILAACAAIAAPAVAFAQQPSPAATAPTEPAKIVSKKDRKVCKTQEEKGSRLGGTRVCRTQAEWDEIAAQQKFEIQRRLSLGPARQ